MTVRLLNLLSPLLSRSCGVKVLSEVFAPVRPLSYERVSTAVCALKDALTISRMRKEMLVIAYGAMIAPRYDWNA